MAPTLLDYQNASPTGRKGGWQGLGRRWSDTSVTDAALLLGTRVTCFISLYSKNLEIKIDGGGESSSKLKGVVVGKQLHHVKGCQGHGSRVCQLPGSPQGLLFSGGGRGLQGRGRAKNVGQAPCTALSLTT